jgi:tRNA 2-selenouridine synthase
MRRVAIEEFLKESKGALLLDVRSPAEYKHAHIPGAVSFPLFTDEERKVVGTTYKQVSRQAAIKIGLDYFGPKMRPMVEEVERLLEQKNRRTEEQGTEEGREYRTDEQGIMNVEGNEIADLPWSVLQNDDTGKRNESQTSSTSNIEHRTSNNKVFVYCWRGGMRSGAVSWLLNLYGFDVTVLIGGYKAFRNHVLKTFEQPYTFKILGGYTGSGKTEVLQALKNSGEKVICLESIALHKGSAFGNINMPPQPSQEMFENLVSCELQTVNNAQKRNEWSTLNSEPETTPNSKLQTSNPAIWLEDESQRIGSVNIPNALWQTMRNAPVYFLEIPFEERLKHITEEYSQCSREKLADAIERIKKRLGGLETKNALQFLAEDNYTECFRVLLQYYDKLYLKGLHNREDISSLLTKILCETVTEKNAVLLSGAKTIS